MSFSVTTLVTAGIFLWNPTSVFSQSISLKQNSFDAQSQRVAETSGSSLQLVRLNAEGTPHLLIANVGVETPIVSNADLGNMQVVSEASLNYMQSVGLTALALQNSAQIVPLATEQVGNSWHSTFQVAYNNIPLRDHVIHLHTGALNGKVMLLRSNIPFGGPNTATPLLTATEAAGLAQSAYTTEFKKGGRTAEEPKLVYVSYPRPDDVRLAYETEVTDGFNLWRYTYDATNGALLEKRDMVECGGFGDPVTVHPNTVNGSGTSLKTKNLASTAASAEFDIGNQSAAAADATPLSGRVMAKVHLKRPTDQETLVPVTDETVTVNGQDFVTDSLGYWHATTTYPVSLSTSFSGPYHTISRQDGIGNSVLTATVLAGSSLDLVWTDSNSDVAERDAFYSVDLVRAHELALDPTLTNLLDPLTINVNEPQACNAFYNPQNVSLNFFHAESGCANTAEIADVVEHEFGHRVNHVVYQKAGVGYMVDLTLNEAFADLHSNFLRDNSLIGIGFFGGSSILRNSYNALQWPKDITPDGHATGQILTGAFWDLRNAIGLSLTESLFSKACYHTPDGNGYNDPKSLQDAFLDVLSAVLLADDDDNNLANGTPHSEQILKAFQKHNIGIQNYFSLSVLPIADAALDAPGYPVHATVTYHGLVGKLDPNKVLLHYSTDGHNYSTLTLSAASDSSFTGTIPKIAVPSAVRYYLTAGTTYATPGIATYPLYTNQYYTFLVGYNSKYLDNCEEDKGWQFASNSDTATSGLWERAQPFGTYDVPGVFIQQDTDHSPNGTMCMVTGNANSVIPNQDAVNGGQVTLTSYALDLSAYHDPIVRYWYYFSNDAGLNGGSTYLRTYYSTDNGTNWRALQTTNLASKGWVPYVVRIRDLMTKLPAQFKLRFVPSDYVAPQVYPQREARSGAIVEAGVDDIEVLEPPLPSGVSANPTAALTEGVYPNPSHRGDMITVSVPENFSLANTTIRMMNQLGVSVANMGKITSSRTARLQLALPSGIAAGVYYIELSDGSQTVTRRINVF